MGEKNLQAPEEVDGMKYAQGKTLKQNRVKSFAPNFKT